MSGGLRKTGRELCYKPAKRRIDVSLERIEITPFAVIAGDVLQNRRSGTLTIIRGGLRKTLYWSQGELVLITSSDPSESLGEFLVRRGVMSAPTAAQAFTGIDPADIVERFHHGIGLDLSARQALLREWIAALFMPLFSYDEGTAAFSDDSPIDPEKRVFLQSTAVLLIEGVRSITNGLVLRRSLGDLKREIEPQSDPRYSLDTLPFQDAERRIAESLHDAVTIESFLKQFPDSVAAARIVIVMLALGLYAIVDYSRQATADSSTDDMQRDLEMLAAIGSSDPRSLRAVALSRQLNSMDFYHLLDLPRAATRAQIIQAAEDMRKRYDPATYPAIVRDAVAAIVRRIDDALLIFRDPIQRQEYDKLLGQRTSRGIEDLQKRVTQRSIAEQNFAKARELSIAADYYGAIVLLKQAVQFAPDHAQAWYLLGACQERNPKWRREAAESYQHALALDPNNVDALISLGDLYRGEGLISRAQNCYEDVLKIAPDNEEAKRRLVAIRKK